MLGLAASFIPDQASQLEQGDTAHCMDEPPIGPYPFVLCRRSMTNIRSTFAWTTD